MTAVARGLGVVVLMGVLASPGPAFADPDGFNRANLRFNQWMIAHVFEPVARAWNVILPKWGQRRVVDFMGNLEGPRDTVNSLLQTKWERAGIHAGRFLLNTTVGVAGFIDVAGRGLEWRADPETFSETLGTWGVPCGSYVILPIIGDYCSRSLGGWVVDGLLNPIGWIPGPPIIIPTAGAYVIRNVNLLAQSMPSPWAPRGEWDAYRESRFAYEPYDKGRALFYEDEADRVAQ